VGVCKHVDNNTFDSQKMMQLMQKAICKYFKNKFMGVVNF